VSRSGLILLVLALVAVIGASQLPKLLASNELTGYPLQHADVIRQQAAVKQVPAELIAGVIYAETKFDARRSPAGAEGLMQLLPSTADFIARKSGATSFTHADLSDPEVNIRYGSWYLRYLLQRYGGNEAEAVAAYNAGMGNVDRWIASAGANGRPFSVSDITFPETRAYTDKVLSAAREYRRRYSKQLGIT
jgi:soluble lytic murein transglycosylase